MTNNDELAQELVKLATKATSGEWVAFIGGAETYAVHTVGDSRCGDVIKWPGFDGQKKAKENARFIAAANPKNILILLAERDADKKQISSWSCLAKKNIEEHEKAVIALDAARQRIAELEQNNCGGALMEREEHHVGVVNKLLDRIAELEALTVSVKWPAPKDSMQGWKVDPEFISKVQDEIGYDEECQCWEGTPSMEMVEAVLIAAAGIKLEVGE